MDIDRIIDNVVKQAKTGAQREQDQKKIDGSGDIENMSLSDLCMSEILSDDIKIEIYERFKTDAMDYIDSFTSSPLCKDVNADKGMFKCSHETFMFCIREFGISYFAKNKYLHDIYREKTEGGTRMREELLYIGLEVYESLTDCYRKVFQIVDCCAFLGISKDYMYCLNDIHARFLKKLHTSTEHSLRIGALTGRGNVTGHAIILNHDYDYTRTTQIIHTNSIENKSASALPVLDDSTQDIVLSDIPANEKNFM